MLWQLGDQRLHLISVSHLTRLISESSFLAYVSVEETLGLALSIILCPRLAGRLIHLPLSLFRFRPPLLLSINKLGRPTHQAYLL
jgi:hypothetical protein